MKQLESKYERAKKRVKELKGLYDHIKIFLVINGILYLFRSGWLDFLIPDGFPLKPYYFDWVHANVLIWLTILGVHALYVYRNKWPFLKNWEERQIKKYMEEEQNETNKFE